MGKNLSLQNIIFITSILFFFTLYGTHITASENEMNEEEMILEAENATLTGVKVENTEQGYSGTGYVTNFSENNQSVTFNIDNIPSESLYELKVGYGSIYGEGKVVNVLLNDNPHGSITLGSGFGEVSAGKLLLKQGTNTITITPNWTWFAIDYIKVVPIKNPPQFDVSKELINSKATTETKALFNYLVDNFGENIISGQQGDPNTDLIDIQNIKELTGKSPAILGLDLMDYSPSRVEFGATTDAVERGIEWYNQGGIVALAWHWNAPKDLLNTEEFPWWSGFNTEATNFDIEYAMNNPESEDFKLLLRDIDAIAEQLKRFQEIGAPILWRPLHEAEGGWFWWGAKGPEPVKELWKLMYNRLTNEHQLNNLIWVWNSIDEDWYPGNDYVDIVSFDSYPGDFDYGPQSGQFEALAKVSNYNKIIAMAENGPIPDPDSLEIYHANYSYFTTWNGLLTEQNSADHINKVYNHEHVITKDELPDFKTYLEEDSNSDETPESEEDTTPPTNGDTDESGDDENSPADTPVDIEEENTSSTDNTTDIKNNGESTSTDEVTELNDEGELPPKESNIQPEEENQPLSDKSKSENDGMPLPNTATPMFNVLLIGLILLLCGVSFYIIYKTKKSS